MKVSEHTAAILTQCDGMMKMPTKGTSKMHRFFDGNQMFGMHPLGWGFWVLLVIVALGAYAMARNKNGPRKS